MIGSILPISKKIIGIEYGKLENTPIINLLACKTVKSELIIEDSFSFNTIDELQDKVDKNTPLFLIINDDQVISKKIIQSSDDTAILTAFPNLNIEEFYTEIYTNTEQTFVNICRKESVEKILEEFTNTDYHIIGFSLGNLSAVNLCEILENKNISTSNSTIKYGDAIVEDIIPNQVNETTYHINGLDVTNKNLLSFSGVFTYITAIQKTSSNFKNINEKLTANFKERVFFNTGFKVGLGSIFILLLISFLFFSNYNSKIQELDANLFSKKTQIEALKTLKEEVNQKEKILKAYVSESSKVSWYLDQLGINVPHSIQLSEMNWQPLLSTIKEGKEIKPQKNTLFIKGTTLKPSEFSSWVAQLEQTEWIKKVQYNDYGRGKKKNESFEIQLLIE